MRALIWSALMLGVTGSAAWADPEPAPVTNRPPAEAASAQRYAQPAAATTRPAPQGYSADARRIADCLATYPGYDHRTDHIQVRPGVTRPCPL
jgi:hypothetical protein